MVTNYSNQGDMHLSPKGSGTDDGSNAFYDTLMTATTIPKNKNELLPYRNAVEYGSCGRRQETSDGNLMVFDIILDISIIFPVQLTTSRIGNHTRLIHTLLNVMTIHTYIHK